MHQRTTAEVHPLQHTRAVQSAPPAPQQAQQPTTQPIDTFLRLHEVERAVGLKKTTIYRRIAARTFPKPIRLSSRVTVWKSSDIAAWQQQQIEAGQ